MYKKMLLDWFDCLDDEDFKKRLLESNQSATNNWAYHTLASECGGLDAKRRIKHEMEAELGEITFAELKEGV